MFHVLEHMIDPLVTLTHTRRLVDCGAAPWMETIIVSRVIQDDDRGDALVVMLSSHMT